MKLAFRKTCIFFVPIILIAGSHFSVDGQQAPPGVTPDCVAFRKIEQKPAPKITEPTAPDVIVETPDDIHIRFELSNNCDRTIFFLFSKIPDEKYPVGYMLFRKDNEWKARTPAWRRVRSLTGINVDWAPLEPGVKIEFEYSDLSMIEGERSAAIFINAMPTHKGRIELLAIPFSLGKR